MTVLLKMSISAGVLILLILIVRILFLNRLPKRTFKILWAVVIARMLIPFSLPVIPSSGVQEPADKVLIIESSKQSGHGEITYTNKADKSDNYTQAAEIIWVFGTSAVFVYFALSHKRNSYSYKAALPCKSKPVNDIINSFDLKRKITVRTSDEISSPLTYGVINPTILLPERMTDLSSSELEYVVAHEITHIKKNDVVYKWFLTLAVCVHWFNPLAWVMLVMAGRDIELVCDEAVLKNRRDIRRDYALTLIKMEEKRVPAFCVGFGSNFVKERIVTIMKFKKTTIVGIVASICLVAGSTAVFAAENNNSDTDIMAQKNVQQSDSSEEEMKNEPTDSVSENAENKTITEFTVVETDGDENNEMDFQFGELYDVDENLEKYGITADGNNGYTYNGKQVAGMLSESADGTFLVSNEEAKDGVYLRVSDEGVEEMSEEEFNSIFEFEEDENGMTSYSMQVEVDG